ncbi:hypothetical protein D0Z00_003170 [Geotrichum galactomycetum]|uniref:Uncharacterized protein n=1 Tax=Geotrichum galactomycetum TaxID=27317 RepID=A0ACB6V2B0_9ASCO|nr:hypothetical protein D0Z00_003170 [Geotrichum candidum]
MTEPQVNEQPAVATNSTRPESPKKQHAKKKPGNKRKPNKTRQAQLQQQQDRSLDAIFAQFARAQLEPQPEATNTTDAAAPASADAVSEFLHKRIRNVQKRKARIDRIVEIGDPAKLNPDQIEALKHKDHVDALLKELTDTLAVHMAQREQEAAARDRAAERTNTLVRVALRDARRAGEAAGADRVRTLVKFLRAASIKRQLQPVVTPQSAAFEALLQMVYMGDESAVAAVERLHLGVEALVADDTVPYRIVRDVSFMSEEDLLDGKDLIEPEETASTAPTATEVSPEAIPAEEEPVAKDDAAAKLSFIQQSEIDPEAPSSATNTETTAVESATTEPATAQSAGEPTSPASLKGEESEETKDPAKKKKKRYFRHRSKKSTAKADA